MNDSVKVCCVSDRDTWPAFFFLFLNSLWKQQGDFFPVWLCAPKAILLTFLAQRKTVVHCMYLGHLKIIINVSNRLLSASMLLLELLSCLVSILPSVLALIMGYNLLSSFQFCLAFLSLHPLKGKEKLGVYALTHAFSSFSLFPNPYFFFWFYSFQSPCRAWTHSPATQPPSAKTAAIHSSPFLLVLHKGSKWLVKHSFPFPPEKKPFVQVTLLPWETTSATEPQDPPNLPAFPVRAVFQSSCRKQLQRAVFQSHLKR